MSTYESEAAAIRARYARRREDPLTPQREVAAGQSGSLLDYAESAELGALYCATHGHRFNAERTFCSSCGNRFPSGGAS